MTLVGCLWIVAMTWICLVGIELSALTQRFLLGAEVTILALFATVALIKGGAATPSLSWLNPLNVSSPGALADGVLLGLFIYWGWDSGVAVNEESANRATGPGRAAVVSTILLVAIYVVVSFAAQAHGGEKFLAAHSGRCAERARRQRPRLSAGQAADPGGADVRRGVDADHDPADRSHDAVDGTLARDPRARSAV